MHIGRVDDTRDDVGKASTTSGIEDLYGDERDVRRYPCRAKVVRCHNATDVRAMVLIVRPSWRSVRGWHQGDAARLIDETERVEVVGIQSAIEDRDTHARNPRMPGPRFGRVDL